MGSLLAQNLVSACTLTSVGFPREPLGLATLTLLNIVQPLGTFFFRRYRLKAETEAQQNWAQNWGFLTTPLEEVNIDFMSPEVIESIISKNKWL